MPWVPNTANKKKTDGDFKHATVKPSFCKEPKTALGTLGGAQFHVEAAYCRAPTSKSKKKKKEKSEG